jgi:hypothetical protein
LTLVIDPKGIIRSIYDEVIDMSLLGPPVIARASYVEPTYDGRWTADMQPVGGPVLGPFSRRSEALEAERAWLEAHWLADAR